MARVAPVPVAVATIPLWDPRLAAPPPAFGVKLGAGSISAQSFSAVTQTQSQHVFNVQVPSLQTYVDRFVNWRTTVQIQWYVNYGRTPTVSGVTLCMPGRDWALAAWPLHRLASNLSLQVNDTSVQLNLTQCLTTLLRLNDSKEGRSITTTPSKLDVYASCTTCSGTASSPYSAYDGVPYGVDPGNGSFPFLWCFPSNTTAGTGTAGNTLLSAANSGYYTDGTTTVQYVNGVPVTTSGVSQYPVAIQVTVAENLLISPFESGSSAAGPEGAIWGISNFVYQAQMQDPASARVIRCLNPNMAFSQIQYGTGANGSPFQSTFLDFNFLSAPLTLYVPPRNEVPYQQFIAYPFSSSGSFGPAGSGLGVTGTAASNVITVAQIPELLIIGATPANYSPLGNTAPPGNNSNNTTAVAAIQGDWYYPLRAMNVTCCNYTGLLTSVTTQTLWRMTTQNGLRMPWLQWYGLAQTTSFPAGSPAQQSSVTAALSGSLGYQQTMPTLTSGGPAVLAFGKDIQLDPTLAPGVSGNFSLSVIATIANNTNQTATPSISLLIVNAGFFNSKAGSSSVTTAPLTTDNVLEAGKQIKLNGGATLTSGQIDRVVGSGWNHKLSTGVMGARHFYEAGPGVEAAGAKADAAGSGYSSGGGASIGGGARTGGRFPALENGGGAAARW